MYAIDHKVCSPDTYVRTHCHKICSLDTHVCLCYGQNGGVIAGSVIGSLFALALIAGVIFAVLYYKRSRNTDGA